jgi:hypothetical protein
MAIAGRILIMPKGDWNSETSYEMLDLVRHNGTSWIAKKESSGVEPTVNNSADWQMVFDASAFIDAKIEAAVKAYMESHT